MKTTKSEFPIVRRTLLKNIKQGDTFRYAGSEDNRLYISLGPIWQTSQRLKLHHSLEVDDRYFVALLEDGMIYKVTPSTRVVPVDSKTEFWDK